MLDNSCWSVGGRTRHIDVQSVLLQELKKAGVLVIKQVSDATTEADISPRIWMGLHSRSTPRFSQEELTMFESEVHHMFE